MASTTGIQQTTLSYHFPTTPRHTASQSLRRQKVEEKFRYTHSAKPPDSKTKAEKNRRSTPRYESCRLARSQPTDRTGFGGRASEHRPHVFQGKALVSTSTNIDFDLESLLRCRGSPLFYCQHLPSDPTDFAPRFCATSSLGTLVGRRQILYGLFRGRLPVVHPPWPSSAQGLSRHTEIVQWILAFCWALTIAS